MAAMLSSVIGDTDSVVRYINEARELGLEVLAPDVNESGFKFTVVGDHRIRFGLGAVKNVGEGAIASIIAGRSAAPYRSLVELCDRIDLRLCNKRVIESLGDAGAWDSLGGHRAQLVAALDHSFSEAQVRQQERTSGQHGLFGEATPVPRPSSPLPDVPPWSEHDRLTREKAVLGFFISGHPLAKYRTEVELFGTRTTATLGTWTDQKVAVAALCAAHPGPTPVLVEWAGEGNGERATARLRSRSLRVDAADDLLAALKDLLGADRVHLVRA